MTLTLKISGNKEATLQAKAREQAVSAEQLAQQILNRELEGRAAPGPATRGRHISERIREIMSDAPPRLLRASLRMERASTVITFMERRREIRDHGFCRHVLLDRAD